MGSCDAVNLLNICLSGLLSCPLNGVLANKGAGRTAAPVICVNHTTTQKDFIKALMSGRVAVQ